VLEHAREEVVVVLTAGREVYNVVSNFAKKLAHPTMNWKAAKTFSSP